MNELRISSDGAAEKKRISFSQDKDGVHKNVDVEEVENGWIMTVRKEWTEGEGHTKDWKYETKKYISTGNPLEKKKEKKSDIMGLFDSVFNNDNLLTVD